MGRQVSAAIVSLTVFVALTRERSLLMQTLTSEVTKQISPEMDSFLFETFSFLSWRDALWNG